MRGHRAWRMRAGADAYLLLVEQTVAHDAPVIGVAVVMEDVGGLADAPGFLG